MFLVDNVDNEIRNTFSDYSSTIPKFKRQKGERSDIHINDTYSYDEFLETWRNENVLWNNDDKSEKYLKFKEKVLQQADINRNSQLRMNTGLWDRMDKESPTLGGLVRLLSIEASEASYEKALAAKPYQTILSAIDNSDGNEENVTEMLTSDNTINYLSGQSDYLDGDVFDWYKRARGEDYISSLLVGSTIGASAALTTKLGVGIRKMAKSGMSPDIVKKVVPKILKSTVKNADDKIIAETTEGLAKLTAKTAFKRLTSKSLPFISCAVGAYLTKKRLDEGDPVGAWFEGASATLSGVEAGALTVAGKSAVAIAVPEAVSTIGGTFSLAGSLNVATVSNILAKIIDVGLFIYDIARAMTKEHTEPMNLGFQAKKAQTKILKGVIKHNKYAKMASAISLVYLAYAKLFEKDPIRDQSLGYDEDYETILKELGPMQGRRFLHSKAINKMLNLIKQIKTLDYSLPTYKQERKVLLNKINNPLLKQRYLKYLKLPPDIKEMMFSSKAAEKIKEIGIKNHLTPPQLQKLSYITGSVLLGELKISDFIKEICEKCKLGIEPSKKIADEITKEIFIPVKESLKKIQTQENQTPSSIPKSVSSIPEPKIKGNIVDLKGQQSD